MVKLDSQIKSAAERMESTKNNFIASYNLLVGQIVDDIEKMKTYLK